VPIGEDIGACPFCSGRVSISRNPNAVMHSMPMCAKFEAEEPLMFLHNMRVAKVGPLPDDAEWPFPKDQEPS
jgi:hypothetical protein